MKVGRGVVEVSFNIISTSLYSETEGIFKNFVTAGFLKGPSEKTTLKNRRNTEFFLETRYPDM